MLLKQSLKQFIENTWDTIKLSASIGDNYITGAIYYRLTEMDFEDFIIKTYISKSLITHRNYNDFKSNKTRFDINKKVKKHFGHGNAFIEHIVPKKYIRENWYKCIKDNDKNAFIEYLRNEASICILTKKEDKLIPRYKGRENLEKALKVYRGGSSD